jgi:hypothetical protein
MPDVTADRAGYVAALPTFAQSAMIIGIHPSGIGRAVKRLGIEPIRWGNRDKHLSVADLMRLAEDAHRESAQTVAGRLLELVAREHPDQLAAIRADLEGFAAELARTSTGTQPAHGAQQEQPKTGDGPAPADPSPTPEERVLRSPVEPETARRLVTLYTLPSIHGEL